MSQLRELWRAALWQKRSFDWMVVFVIVEALALEPARTARGFAGLSSRGFSSLTSLATLLGPALIPYFAALVVSAFALLGASKDKLFLSVALSAANIAYVPHVIVSLVWAILVYGAGKTLPDVRHIVGFVACVPVLAIGAWQARVGAQPSVSPSLGVRAKAYAGILLLAVVVVDAKWVADRWDTLRPIGKGDRISAAVLANVVGGDDQILTFPRSKPVVFDFWATWCPPCREALPAWQTMSKTLAGQADFYSVNQEPESAALVQEFVRNNHYEFAVHTGDALSQRLQIEVLPTMVIIAPDGTVREYWVGGGALTEVTAVLR